MIPICYHPTTIILIDDDVHYLNNISLHLPHKYANFKFYTNPRSGLKAIEEYLKTPIINKRLNYYEQQNSHNINDLFKINFHNLTNELYNDDRFQEISTIVVDYNMPRINGLELLNEFKNDNVLKILLTGDADEHIAIQAFNDQLIDYYIKKQDPKAEQILFQKILAAQKRYFLNFTKQLIKDIPKNNKFPIAIFDSNFEKYFFDLVHDLKIIEYYQFEQVGSYILIDANGNEHCLFTQNEDQLTAFYIELKDLVGIEDKTSIKNHFKMPCLPIMSNNIISNPEQWIAYLNPIQKTFDSGPFYCSIKHQGCGLNLENILPFKIYLDSQISFFNQ